MSDTESRVVLTETNQVIARFDGPNGYNNFKASMKWAMARGYSSQSVVCGPGSKRDIGAESVSIVQVKA